VAPRPLRLRNVEGSAGVRGDVLELDLASEDCAVSSSKTFRPTLRLARLIQWCREEGGRGVRLTTHRRLAPRCSMPGVIPLLPLMPLWPAQTHLCFLAPSEDAHPAVKGPLAYLSCESHKFEGPFVGADASGNGDDLWVAEGVESSQ
jgi:hypothetical protein